MVAARLAPRRGSGGACQSDSGSEPPQVRAKTPQVRAKTPQVRAKTPCVRVEPPCVRVAG